MAVQSLSVDLEKVSVSLAGKRVLHGLSWSLRPGTHWAVLGPNGAGKSTLLKLLRGDMRPEQTAAGGSLGRCVWTVDGEADTSPLVIKPLARLLSAEQQRLYVRKGWEITGLGLILSAFTDSLLPSPPDAAATAAASRIAETLGASALLDRPVTSLSQGQLRLALLARALASSPRLLLLDEPFDGLDAASRGILHAAVDRAADCAAVVVTAHRREDIPGCITHALSLDGGRITYCGPLAGAARRGGPEPAVPEIPETPSPPPARAARGEETRSFALELEDVDVYVARQKVLHGLTWSLPVGENWRIAGDNGSGKSTLLRAVAGLEHVALGGRLRWFGKEHPSLETRLRETGYLSDLLHAAYTYDLTGMDLVLSGFDGSVGLWRKMSGQEREEARRWIDFLGLASMARTPVSRLSSGTARRFFLARALVGPIRLLLLDEPCSGLDAAAREQFLAALDSVLASGVQCLFVSHHEADVPRRVTHELLLEGGRIKTRGPR